jgi:dipeptidyl aminopeptidase/acylaminoacyl peptidase
LQRLHARDRFGCPGCKVVKTVSVSFLVSIHPVIAESRPGYDVDPAARIVQARLTQMGNPMILNLQAIRRPTFGMIAILCFAVPARAARPDMAMKFTVDRYLQLQSASDPQMSPDGTQIVYTRTSVNKDEDKLRTAIWTVGTDGLGQKFVANGSDAVWSPDGKSIAYVGKGHPKGKQIFVLRLSHAGPGMQITRLSETPANLHWSPDGRYIGFTMVVPDPEKWVIHLPAAPAGAKWAGTPFFTERLHYQLDRHGLTKRGFRHLFLVAADGGAPRQITHGDWNVNESVWEYIDQVDWGFTPDGRYAIVEGFKEGDPDLNVRYCYIYRVNLETGFTTRLTRTTGSWREPAISPDGRTIAYVGFPRSGEGYPLSKLYTMSEDGGSIKLRSAGFDREPRNLTWAADGKTLYFTAEDQGRIHIYSWSSRVGVRQLTKGAEVVTDISAGRAGIVAVRSEPQVPSDVELVDPRAPRQQHWLTQLNEKLLRSITLSKAHGFWFDSTSGAHVQGWIIKPPDFDPARSYPLLLSIHGGPFGMYNVGFNASFQNFAANGYIVLYINPRGSTGYGDAFTNAIDHHYPGPDYDDLMAGVDAVIKQGNIDVHHMFVTGCSGGGVLSSWVIGHTNRFAAAAVRCPVTDWIGEAGETDIPYYIDSFFRKPFWEDPEDWLAESPLMYVGNVQTPTLMMVGALDRRCPISQTEEYYSALKIRNVPAALLIFPDEYHGTSVRKPSDWMRTQLYIMSWFHRFGSNPFSPAPR